jgi:hypothetical protein
MKITEQIAKHFKEVFLGGNWTWSNLKDQLADVTREEALTKKGELNTIALLTYHIHYYVQAVLKVLEGGPLDAHDKYSFALHPPETDEAWNNMKQQVFTDVEKFAEKVAALPDEILLTDFAGGKYGNYYRNFHGIIEHTHYHLGQIAVIKKMIRSETSK